MNKHFWVAMTFIVLGTFLMRALPLLWMSRRIAAHTQNGNTVKNMPVWLSVMGPAMIAAMFGTSFIPPIQSLISWSAAIGGGLVTLLVWYWRRSLGLPVFFGVIVYGIIRYIGS